MAKSIYKILIFLLAAISLPGLIHGQKKVTEGMVTTFDSIPLRGASIEIKSSNEVVYTDSLGMFAASCLPKDRLKVRAYGFSKRNVKVENQVKYVLVNLKLLPGPKNRELAIGYGHVMDSDKLYAISNVNETDTDFSRYSSIHQILEEQFSSSVEVRSGGVIVIRNSPAIKGSNAALLIIDGKQVDEFTFANLNPVDIAGINILKDASASVYGSRGANGVVIIETKRGR